MLAHVDVVSDVVCPWCFIGKRHLDEALGRWREDHPADSPSVTWHAFQLNPGMPRTGMDRATYVAQKFGGAERAREIYARVETAGRSAGIGFDFARMQIQPNTRNAHRLIAWAAGQDRQHDMVEALFRGYFLETLDFTRDEVLAEVAEQAGLDRAASLAFLGSGDLDGEVAEDEALARDIGVTGVPFFIFNRRLAVSGAQPASVLLEAMAQASA